MLPVMFSVCHHHAEITTNRHYGTSCPDMTEKLLTGTLSLHTKKKKKKKREREKKYEKQKRKTSNDYDLDQQISCTGEAINTQHAKIRHAVYYLNR